MWEIKLCLMSSIVYAIFKRFSVFTIADVGRSVNPRCKFCLQALSCLESSCIFYVLQTLAVFRLELSWRSPHDTQQEVLNTIRK
jgi:hypothetical protein